MKANDCISKLFFLFSQTEAGLTTLISCCKKHRCFMYIAFVWVDMKDWMKIWPLVSLNCSCVCCYPSNWHIWVFAHLFNRSNQWRISSALCKHTMNNPCLFLEAACIYSGNRKDIKQLSMTCLTPIKQECFGFFSYLFYYKTNYLNLRDCWRSPGWYTNINTQHKFCYIFFG